MSELMNMRRGHIRWELMATVSALALFASVYEADRACAADDNDRPTVWIELGAQSEQVSGFGDPFVPPFTSEIIADGFASPLQLQRALSQSFGGESTISFQPENSDWIFSISALYGRANGHKGTLEQTPGGPRHVSFTFGGSVHTGTFNPQVLPNGGPKFSEPRINNNETHAILDFQTGKDIGLGLFSARGESTVNFGVRFAQFSSKQSFNLIADPDFYFPLDPVHNAAHHHTYTVASHMERSFRGLGPSVSWNASAPLIGNTNDGGMTLDWGVNAAILFGRQKAQGQHQTMGNYYKSKPFKYTGVVGSRHIQRSGNPVDRSRTVIVPNVGGFAGASFCFSNAKVSFGYRADFFFGAMDGGIDTARKETRGFYGPFASVSVGLGG
jgi:iron complex outermembrane recepter protein